MVKKKETIDRGLMIILNLLLTVLVSVVGFGGKQVIQNQKDTVEAVNELRIVLVEHSGRIEINRKKNIEQDEKNLKQDAKIEENTEGIIDLDDRVDILEYKSK